LAEKILVVIPSLRRGGAERTVALITREWARDHDVTIAVFDASDQAFPAAETARTVDLQCPASRSAVGKTSNAITRIRRLSSLIRSEAPDRIITFMESANFPSILACLSARRLPDLTVSVRNNPHVFPTYYRFLIPLLYRWPGRIVTGSEGVRHALISEFNIPTHKILAIPNPIDAVAMQRAAALPIRDRIPEKPFVLGVGRLVPQKGFDLLVKAWHQSKTASDHVLLILGEGPERERLTKLVRDLGMQGTVRMPGSMASPPPYMRAARCFVLSSRYEGWPNVVMEAMACECPVVAFDCPYGPSEIIEDGRSGVLVNPENVEALARAMDEVIGNKNTRARLARLGQERVAEFDSEVVARRWLESR
jgi:glycosyltransferase involved in cell wall biosynthesis